MHGIAPPPHMQHFEYTQQRKKQASNINRYALGEKFSTTYRDSNPKLDEDIMRVDPKEYSAVPVCTFLYSVILYSSNYITPFFMYPCLFCYLPSFVT